MELQWTDCSLPGSREKAAQIDLRFFVRVVDVFAVTVTLKIRKSRMQASMYA